MPLDVSWVHEGDVVALHFVGPLDVYTMRDAVHTSLGLLQHSQISFLLDFTQSEEVDPSVLELSSLSEWIYHANARWFAYVNAQGLMKAFARMRHRGNAQMFHTVAEAEVFLLDKLLVND